MNQAPTGPLAGIKVLDMSSVVLGPLATLWLADLGADVVKVESPRGGAAAGDTLRHSGRAPVEGLGPMFVALNRNKRSVALDLGVEADKAAFLDLVRWADVFIHNVRMAGMRRLGADYEALRAINPALIYVHCAGFGEDGPYANLPCYDDLIQAASGVDQLETRRTGAPPAYVPFAAADKTVGLAAANATLAALVHRERSGEGQYVQVPMFETFTYFTLVEHLFGRTWVSRQEPAGFPYTLSPDRRPYETLNGYISILPHNDPQWRTLFELGGATDVPAKPRAAMVENATEFHERVRQMVSAKTTEEWLELLTAADIPAMRCIAIDDLPDDPHLQAVNFFQTATHPEGGDYVTMKHPVKYSRTPPSIYRHPPRLGEQTDEVLRDCKPSAIAADR